METIRSGPVIPCLSVFAGPEPGLSLAPTHFPEAGGKSQDREAHQKCKLGPDVGRNPNPWLLWNAAQDEFLQSRHRFAGLQASVTAAEDHVAGVRRAIAVSQR